MTLPIFPKSSLSEDDALDQALNAWVSDERSHRHSELVEESTRKGSLRCEAAPRPPSAAHQISNDALEFHRWADETRRTDPAASGPAASTWNRVLHSTAQTESRGGDMNSAALRNEPQSAIIQEVRPWNRQQISRFLNNAAMLVIVFGVAFAGAFAVMQINQPNGSNGQFALFGQHDEAAVCDVEPMTVDEVMEIVENPYKYAEPAAYGGSSTSPAPWLDEFAVVQPMMSGQLSSVIGTVPTDTAMEEALPVLDQHIACVENGTVAQSLRFVDPFSIQEYVTINFAFYRNQEQVRNFVEDWISQGPESTAWQGDETGEVLTFSPNRNTDEARTQVQWLGLGFNQVLWLGSHVMDENGNELARHDAVFQVVDGEQQPRWTMYTMVYSMYTDQWYVVTGDWPTKPRI